MASAPETTQLKPAYGSTQWYEKFLDTIKRRKLTKIDSEFLKDVAPHNEAKMKLGLRFLGLIEEDGTCTPRLASLMVEGEDEFRQRLEQVLKEAYADVFSSIKLDKALKKDVTNHFIEKWKMAISSANQATTIFSYLAQKAGIELSDDLKTKEVKKTSGERKEPRKERKSKSQTIDEEEGDGEKKTSPKVEGMHKIEWGKTILIYLKESEDKTEREKIANQAKQLIDMYCEG